MRKQLGVIRHAYARPLFDGLSQGSPDSPVRFSLVEDAASRLVGKLLQDELDGAFLSPIEYAKYSSQLKIVPGVCCASTGESRTIELHFGDNLRNVASLALIPESTSEVVLAKILLAEKFDLNPQLIALQSISQDVLHKADSVLTVGNDCAPWSEHSNYLDLVDEWCDLTDLPFVHGLWLAKEGRLSQEEMKHLSDVVLNGALTSNAEFSYLVDDEIIASIDEFFRMAYFHGMLPEIPALQWIDQTDS